VKPIRSLPNALESWDEIVALADGRAPAIFLDYDGTLTPIVERPEDAHLSPDMKEALRSLAALAPVTVVSGRDVSFVVTEVDLPDVIYLGSHGFDIVTPEGVTLSTGREDEFAGFLGSLDAVEAASRERLADIPGANVERKKYAVAVHYRQVAEADVPAVEAVVDELLGTYTDLRKSGGKKVFELRPDIDWDKGRAVRWTIEALGLADGSTLPVYIGDDLTDEDAFAAISDDGLTIVVGSDARESVAAYRVPVVNDVRTVLMRIAEMAEGVAE
jgi:trehalose-phosphatase